MQEGLKGEYEKKENPVIRDWIRQLMALTMLPAFAIPLAWTWLKDLPPSGSPATDGKTRSLSNYYERTWINDTVFLVVVLHLYSNFFFISTQFLIQNIEVFVIVNIFHNSGTHEYLREDLIYLAHRFSIFLLVS